MRTRENAMRLPRVIQVLSLPAVLLFQVSLSSPQEGDRTSDRSYQRQEVPDDPYIPVPRSGRPTSPPYRVSSSGFFSTQVNVDADGQNIVGDAANEPSIAVDPTNPLKIVIGWRQFDTISNNFRQAGNGYTTDGGLTWNYHDVIEPGIFRSDPVLDSDSEGNLYYNSLTSDGANYTCQVFKSSDGGVTWDGGTNAWGGDKQWMVIDRTGGIGDGHAYSFWTVYFSSCFPGHFTRSTDYGASFEACLVVPGQPYWGTLAVGPDGELYVAGAGSTSDFQVIRSETARDSSQGVSWSGTLAVDLDGEISGNGGNNTPNPDGLLGQTWVAVDHSSGPARGNVYVLCSVERNSNNDPLDVMFARSTNGGVTWSSPVRVNDDPGTTAWQWFGTMSVAPNGRIDVIWLDTRDNPGTVLSSLYYSYSSDAGVTWAPNERLSDEFDPHVGWPQQDKMGDYFHMVSDNEGAHLAWAGTFNGEQDVYYGRILAEPVIPMAPLLVYPEDQSGNQPLAFSLLWAGSVGASGYRVQLDTNASFTAPIVDDSTVTGTSRNLEDLVTATTYYWRVNARGTGGTSEWSEAWSFTTSVDPPTAPALEAPPDGATGVPTDVTFMWDDTTTGVTYRLQVGTDESISDTILDVSGLTGTTFEALGLPGEVTHYWRVNASGTGGTSVWSTVWSFTTTVAPPAAPLLFSPPDGAVHPSTSALFRWNAAAGAETYHLQLATDDQFGSPVVDDSTLTGTTRVVGNLTDGTTYYWRVRAKNDGGTSPWSDVWSVSIVVTGVEEETELIPTDFVLYQNYPNPFNPSTNIRFGLPEKTHVLVEVFDILGRRVAVLADREYSAGYHGVHLDARNFGGGVYFFRLTASGFVETRKLILVK